MVFEFRSSGGQELRSVGSPFLSEDVAIEGWVLGLFCIAHLVDWVLHWVHHSSSSTSHYSSKLSSMCQLGRASLCASDAIDGSVVSFTCLAVCKANLVIFSDLAVDLVHWKCVFYFCHIVFGNRACG